jgi:hypothetical protein
MLLNIRYITKKYQYKSINILYIYMNFKKKNIRKKKYKFIKYKKYLIVN